MIGPTGFGQCARPEGPGNRDCHYSKTELRELEHVSSERTPIPAPPPGGGSQCTLVHGCALLDHAALLFHAERRVLEWISSARASFPIREIDFRASIASAGRQQLRKRCASRLGSAEEGALLGNGGGGQCLS
jgi:hypothetical protein